MLAERVAFATGLFTATSRGEWSPASENENCSSAHAIRDQVKPSEKGVVLSAISQVTHRTHTHTPTIMYSPDYEKRILQYYSPVARSLYNRPDGDSGATSSLDRFIPCR